MNDDEVVLYREFQQALAAIERRFVQFLENHAREVERNERELARTQADLNRRLEGMNEFREQLRLQAATFVTRELYEPNHTELRRRLDMLEQKQANFAGRAFATAAVIGVVIALAQLLIHFMH